jgi:molybdenum cofactor cytidylyltransferase
MPDLRISAIVLAAGESRRMGGRLKLTLDAGGQPMIRRTVQAVLGIAPVETIVVTGFAAAEITAALAGLPVRFVHNRDFQAGQPASVAAGVRALEHYCHAVMVVPGDQALLTSGHLTDLVAAFRAAEDRSIVVPFHRGQRGNPIIFAAHHIPEVTAGGLNIGCRHLIETNGDQVAQIPFKSDAYIVDCDTPADYAALVTRIEREVAVAS